MRPEYEIVIADTSCFILLDNINELDLLRIMFDHVVTTDIIANEFGLPLPEWVQIRKVKDINFLVTLDVDAGEASAITLAIESEPSLLILDDNKGRNLARKLNLNFTGTLGLFLKAKQTGIIPDVKALLNKVQQTNFRYSEAVIRELLTLAKE